MAKTEPADPDSLATSEPKGDATPDDSTKAVEVYSLLDYPYQIPVRGDDEEKLFDLTISPGKNLIAEEAWNLVDTDDGRLASRIASGKLKIDKSPSDIEKQSLAQRPSTDEIENLCDKARPVQGAEQQGEEIPEDDVFVQGGQSLAEANG